MGENALNKAGERIKIGTCSSMYYLRYEDRFDVSPLPGNVDPHTDINLRWRLPYPDEDGIAPGDYDNFNRTYPLHGFDMGFTKDELRQNPGNIQLHHPCGLLVNVACYHGKQLPEKTDEYRPFWNGRMAVFFGLAFVKNIEPDILVPVVTCRACEKMWWLPHHEWGEVLDCIKDDELKRRLKILRDLKDKFYGDFTIVSS